MFYNLFKKFQPIFYKILKWHYRKVRIIKKRGIQLQLYPTVFHPGFYLSTDLFLDYLLQLELDKRSILELGCGNAFIILYLAKNKNIKAYASDINKKAIEGLIENSVLNNVTIESFRSDLFDDIPKIKLNYILINPPYFEREINSVDEYAFFTGKDFSYFKKLFKQVKEYVEDKTIVLLIMSVNVNFEAINNIAHLNNMSLEETYKTSKKAEEFIIYKLQFKK